MSEPKPFASLSSGLLARKGAAKPAMRPQGFGQLGGHPEDLGWNDMGYGNLPIDPIEEELPEHVPSSIAALTPAPRPNEPGAKDYYDSSEYGEEASEEEEESEVESPVVEQQRAIAASFSASPAVASAPVGEPAPVVALPRRPRQAPGLKEKAAFTLRLDRERHLKLRLACALRHRSAQQIVSEALDEYLKSLPELDALAQQAPARAGKRN